VGLGRAGGRPADAAVGATRFVGRFTHAAVATTSLVSFPTSLVPRRLTAGTGTSR
jgi:hypothetical protein